MKKMGTKKKKIKIENFPQVWKGYGQIAVIYRNHVEFYQLANTDYTGGSDGEKNLPFDPYSEIDMAKGNRMRRVHGNKEIHIRRG